MVWKRIIAILQSREHEVVCVTSRRKTFESIEEIRWATRGTGMNVIFCSYNAKAEHMKKLGRPVDIWIDDDPKTIDPDGVIDKPQYDKWKNSGN